MKKIIFTAPVAALLLLSCAQAPQEKGKEITYTPQPPYNPPTYVCYKAPAPIKVDGKLSPEEWDAIPWTSEFVDIEGNDKRPKPLLQTRAKMTYDDDGMYFAALMEEPHVWATIKDHDAVIYQDNDFEIFLNPTNDTHNYLEYEMNALGTDWDLFLTRPYRDGPQVLNNWEFAGMKSAVYVDGTLNNPKDTDKSWSVEVFIPWAAIYQVARKGKPDTGDHIRVNFSRVEWTTEVQDGKYVKVPIKGEDKIREYNWVWAPTGVINIHMPEYWGFVQISDLIAGKGETPFVADPNDEVKWLLRNLYYRMNEYVATFGQYATSIVELKPEELCPAEQARQIKLFQTPSMYEITAPGVDGKTWHIRQDGLVWSSKK